MRKHADGSITLTAKEVEAMELIMGEWEECAEDALKADGEPTALQDAFIIEYNLKAILGNTDEDGFTETTLEKSSPIKAPFPRGGVYR